GNTGSRDLAALCGVQRGRRAVVASAAGAVRRLFRLAAAMAARRRPGAPARLLEESSGRGAGARVADRPPATARGELPRRAGAGRVVAVHHATPEGIEPARRGDPLHDTTGLLPDPLVSLQP